ncbi:MAG: cytochrome c biogenesis protein ResB, partial [Campylobacterales bacterium]|nr:cytochrome c biogenesis protein ResB [Campylobacterales bacterium]
MTPLFKALFGMPTMVFLLLLFAFACGTATFIENDFGTESAWALIYASWWFALIQLWLGLGLLYSAFAYKLLKKEKLPSLVFHASFLFILLGAGLTRYYGFEGTLHIREGKMENRVVSMEPFVQLRAFKENEVYSADKQHLVSLLDVFGVNSFRLNLPIGNEKASLRYEALVPNATTRLVSDESGESMINFVVSYKQQPRDIIMRQGEVFDTPDLLFAFAKDEHEVVASSKPTLYMYIKNGAFFMRPTHELTWFKMADSTQGQYPSMEETSLAGSQLYTFNNVSFTPKELFLKGKEVLVNEPAKPNEAPKPHALVATLSYQGESKEVVMYGHGRGRPGYPTQAMVGGQMFQLEWGSKSFELPFNIELIEFQLDRYPGSRAPSSYASEVKVVDAQKNITLPWRIYMNHVLDYRGFRFFQSSYDQDEKGTILSVNQDPGKWPTYLGYFLLAAGLLFNLLNPKSHFGELIRSVNKDMGSARKLTAIVAFMGLLASSQPLQAQEEYKEHLPFLKSFDLAHANHFGTIVVQGADGRMKPVDTIAHEVLNKVYRKSSYEGIMPNQVVLGMMSSPSFWQTQPMIRISHPELKNILGVDAKATYASFNDFFEQSGDYSYKLAKHAELASRKKPAERNLFDKDVLKVDERLNVCYMVYTGEVFRMVPKVNDPNRTWYSPKAAISQFPPEEALEARMLLVAYFDAIAQSLESGNWSKA